MVTKTEQIAAIRVAFREFYKSIGCGCCENREEKEAAEEKLAKLLDFKPYSDGSGYAFYDDNPEDI